jgi:hypothetical protein
MRLLSILIAASALFVGCSRSVERAEAHYYQRRADKAAEHGRYYKAAREQEKADRHRENAAEAPLP